MHNQTTKIHTTSVDEPARGHIVRSNQMELDLFSSLKLSQLKPNFKLSQEQLTFHHGSCNFVLFNLNFKSG